LLNPMAPSHSRVNQSGTNYTRGSHSPFAPNRRGGNASP